MPIITKLHDPVDATLPCDEDKPEVDRIVWKARPLSSADQVLYFAEWDRVYDLPLAEQVPALHALIRQCAVGWSNVTDDAGQALPFGDDTLSLFPAQAKLVFARQLPTAAGWAAATRGTTRQAK